jgi:hypothetical protein
MNMPQILGELLQLLFDLAVPAAMCTMTLAGLALRQESGMNFEPGGRFQRWILWSVLLLTLPQFLAWFAAQGIAMPPQAPTPAAGWLRAVENAVNAFVSDVLLARLVPVFAAFLVIKSTLDAAQGASPVNSLIPAFFLLTVGGSVQLMRQWNSGGELATADMLVSIWNYLAGTLLPEAAALALVAAVISYARRRPFAPLVFSALAFLSVSGVWKLVQAMAQ